MRIAARARALGKALLTMTLALAVQLATLLSCSPTTAFAVTGVVTEVVPVEQVKHQIAAYERFGVDGKVAYCGESGVEQPPLGATLERMDDPGIPELDYVLYHGYDGRTVFSVYGLSEEDSRAATQIAVFLAVGEHAGNYSAKYPDGSGNMDSETQRFLAALREAEPATADAAEALYGEAVAYAASPHAPEQGFAVAWTNYGDGQSLVMAGDKNGRIELAKVSADESMTAGNSNYSLAGATYGVYADEACTQQVTTLTTDEGGHAMSDELAAGTYWVRETAAPRGYVLDETVYQVDVVAAQTVQVNGGTVADVPESGGIDLVKVSANEGLTGDNACYRLDGAVFGVYADADCSNRVAELTTDEQGHAACDSLAPGTYWVREDRAPQGFAADDTAYEVQVRAGETARVNGGTVSDEPLATANLALVRKVDAQGDALSEELAWTSQGDASLAGAEFTVTYHDGYVEGADALGSARRTWVFATDEQGFVAFDAAHKVSGDDLFVASDGTSGVLPLGTYAVRETKAPEGYALTDTATHLAQVVADENGGASWRTLDGWTGTHAEQQLDGRAVADAPQRGGLALRKVDAQTEVAQGDASLAGIEFEIVNQSEAAVIVNGVAYAPGEVIEALVLTTDEQGHATTAADALPMGRYLVRERATNAGYLMASEPQSVTLGLEDLGKVKELEQPFANDVVRGGVMVGKIDRELGAATPQGTASLEGATIAVELASENNVQVDGQVYEPGEVVATLVTDADGQAKTGELALPYGTYILYELEASPGYLLTPRDEWSPTVEIREQGQMVDLTGVEQALPELVARGDLAGVKVRESDMARLAGVPFVIESLTTGEAHVVVTDENGEFSSAADWVAHTEATNANDAAVARDEQGVWRVVDVQALDAFAGVWFAGTAGKPACEPDDARGALPYDRYRVSEVACDANEGLQLASFEVQVPTRESRDGLIVDLGTIDNRPGPSIGTELSWNDAHTAPAEDKIELVDVVAYSSLDVGTSYELEGELHLVGDDGSDLGVVAKERTKFVAEQADGTVEVAFVLDARELAGKRVVAFETLTSGGEVVATHADLEDEGQTVVFARIGTTLATVDGAHEAYAAGQTVLVDTVAYEGLVPGNSYVVIGSLIDKQTGKSVVDADGTAVTARTTFVANETTGSVEVRFAFDASSLTGHDVVAFERLMHAGATVAAHEDLEDEGQTVSLPSIGTTLTTEEGAHETLASEGVHLVDEVRYEGLTPGATYHVTGTLMDAETGQPVEGADGPVTAGASFVASERNGTVKVTFAFDAVRLAGTKVVAFERLERDGRLVAVHEDLQDAGQTVTFPGMGTQASVGEDGAQETEATGTVTIYDLVSYRQLKPGVEYVVRGSLHRVGKDGEDLGALAGIDGKEVRAETTFVPTEPSGEVEVTFEVDASGLGGSSLVAFEELYRDNVLVAVHADIASKPQTVSFVQPEEPVEPEKPAKPVQPETPKRRQVLPQTGAGTLAVALVGVGCLTAVIGGALAHRPLTRHAQGKSHRRG